MAPWFRHGSHETSGCGVDTITSDLVPISAPKTGSNDPRFDPLIVQVLTETGKLVP